MSHTAATATSSSTLLSSSSGGRRRVRSSRTTTTAAAHSTTSTSIIMGMDAPSVELMRSIFDDKRKNDDALFTLKEKVMRLEFEKELFQVNKEHEMAQQRKELTAEHDAQRRVALGFAAIAYRKLECELQEERRLKVG